MERETARKLRPFDKQFVQFCEKYPEGAHMLKKAAHSESTKSIYSRGVYFLTEFLHKDPTAIVTEYTKDIKASPYDAYDKWEKIFDHFADFLQDKKLSSGSVKVYYTGAKALIDTNVPRSMRLRTETPEANSRTIPGITLENLKKVYGMCNSRERAFISVLKDSGMSCDDAVRLKLKDLEGFERGEQFAHLSVYRQKEKVEYETFLGPNAVDDLKAYLELRKQRGEKITPETSIFGTIYGEPGGLNQTALATTFARIHKKTGIVISTHRLRKFFETYMALVVRHPIILKYWMGHKIHKGRDIEARYIIPPTPEQLALYKQAYPNIDITGATVESRVKALEDFKKSLTPEQQETARRAGFPMRKTKQVSEPHVEDKEKCEDDEHCQRVVSEEELPKLLSEGWTASLVLPTGKIVVQKA
jgi:integrase/recombinase XerD